MHCIRSNKISRVNQKNIRMLWYNHHLKSKINHILSLKLQPEALNTSKQ